RVLPIILRVLGRLFERRIAAPVHVTRVHVGAVAHAEQQRTLRSVGIFVHFARRMHHERARRHRDGFLRRAHGAAAGKAEIDFRRVRVAVVRADLARLPAGDGHVAAGDLAEDFFHVALGIPLLLALETEDMHALLLLWSRISRLRRSIRATAYHLTATDAPSNTSARRRRVPGVVSAGSASREKNPRSAISRLGRTAGSWRNTRTTNTATWSRGESTGLKN